ncbi:hypothetical protein Tco_0678560 [Tanacetum coccineum]|uniref:Ubiquitin-like protease family profile domain-containing protein n=1 Tax=Tanacetum coccineum TaxID=301880 RepID=A0ABQ4XFL3_9ASTR
MLRYQLIPTFWATVKAKTVNGEVQLQALVDGKKITITKLIVRRDLQLEDAEGVDCLPNATIFEQLTLIGSKTTTWNEFSITMVSAIICLPINQKFNFSKYIFESMVKNLENVFGKFLMYPRFIQVFLDKQIEGMPTQKRIYIAPSYTKKIFGNEKGWKRSKRKDTEVPQPSSLTTNVADEVVNEEMDDSLERAATTATGLEVEQDSGNIYKTQSKATLNEPGMRNVLNISMNTLARKRVLALETTKTTQATEIASLKKRVKKLKRRNKTKTHELKRLYRVGLSKRVESSKDKGLGEEDASKQGRKADIDANEAFLLIAIVYVVKTAEETRSMVEEVTTITILVSAATTTTITTAITDVEMTLAQALAELKSAKPKATTITTTPTLTTITAVITTIAISTRPIAKGIVIHKLEQAPTPIVSSQQPSQVKIQDKEVRREEERIAKEKAQQIEETNIAWDDVQAKIEADYQLAQRLQAQEQEELTNAEKARLTELVEESSKKIDAEIAQESSSKRAGDELEQESFKKQKLEEDKESEELKQCLEIIPDDGDDVTIDATHLPTKSPTIVDYKIHKEGKKIFFQIIRADVKARFKKTKRVNYMDNFLLLILKTMFKHHVEDNVWKNQQGLVKVLNWNLYYSCGVHCVTMQSMLFYLLVEKMYPLTKHTLHQMFNDVKLQVDYECEMAFELLRLVKKQLKKGYIPE